MNEITIEWGGTYDLGITGKMLLGVTIERDLPHCTLGDAIDFAKMLFDVYGHHGLSSLDIVDANTGEIHCHLKRGE